MHIEGEPTGRAYAASEVKWRGDENAVVAVERGGGGGGGDSGGWTQHAHKSVWHPSISSK